MNKHDLIQQLSLTEHTEGGILWKAIVQPKLYLQIIGDKLRDYDVCQSFLASSFMRSGTL
jgi:hypothetical protein